MAKINICIYYINNISNALGIVSYLLKITPRNMIKTWSKRTTTFINNVMDFNTR